MHGTVSEYNNHGCRCPECRAAKREYDRQAREDRQAAEVPPELHGTDNAYTNYGCRCPYCREARHDWHVARQTGRPRRSVEEIRRAVDQRTEAARQAQQQRLRLRVEWEASRAERRAAFEELVAPLDPRSGQVLQLRFGIDREVPRTLEEVGAYFNLTRERIRQIERDALARLRVLHPEAGDIVHRLQNLVVPPRG
jgi:RNA polymerase sigma factor (sigma-70 family)